MLTILYPREIKRHDDYLDCICILQWWSICYYQCCYGEELMPVVPDSVNDHLYRMVEKWEEANPDEIKPDSPTQQVGYGEILDDAIRAKVKADYIKLQLKRKR